jgi:DNA primase
MDLDAKTIKSRIDLVDYCISQGVMLKPLGISGEYLGNCPFHEDVKPSFQVNRKKGLWHCFGCGAGGDVISFVMKQNDVRFREALAILGNQLDLQTGNSRGGAGRSDILRAAADYWHERLTGSASAGNYLRRRGIGSPEIIERYGIGFAPGHAKTRDRLLSRGFTLGDIESAGLTNRRGFDSFFGRVTFPLLENGEIINIYGRSLSNNYRHMYLPGRRDVIFNIERVHGDRAILTESVIDALSLLALGFENAVSSLSVRLAGRQIEMLAQRFARVEIIFDGDAAGAAGARAASAALRGKGAGTGIVMLPEGSDVNSLVMEGVSLEEIENLIAAASGGELKQ